MAKKKTETAVEAVAAENKVDTVKAEETAAAVEETVKSEEKVPVKRTRKTAAEKTAKTKEKKAVKEETSAAVEEAPKAEETPKAEEAPKKTRKKAAAAEKKPRAKKTAAKTAAEPKTGKTRTTKAKAEPVSYDSVVALVKKKTCRLKAKKDLAAQFQLTGSVEGIFYIKATEGKVAAEPYEYNNADLYVTVDADTFIKLLEKKADFAASVEKGLFETSGQLSNILFMKKMLF